MTTGCQRTIKSIELVVFLSYNFLFIGNIMTEQHIKRILWIILFLYLFATYRHGGFKEIFLQIEVLVLALGIPAFIIWLILGRR